MELEIKHIAPYLPYGLKFELDSFDGSMIRVRTIEELIGLNKRDSDGKEEFQLSGYGWRLFEKYKECKPLLIPLSKITDHIEASNIAFDEFAIFGCPNRTKELNKTLEHLSILSYSSLQSLFQMKYDVFGLIEKGLAISKALK